MHTRLASIKRMISLRTILIVVWVSALLITTYWSVVTRFRDTPPTVTAREQLERRDGVRRDAVETTPEGVKYIWVGSEYVIRMMQPDASGILGAKVWIHPSALDATVQYGSRQVTLPIAQSRAPRQLYVLVDDVPFDGMISFTIKVNTQDVTLQDADLPITWAFSELLWVSSNGWLLMTWLVAVWSMALLGLRCIEVTSDWRQVGRWSMWSVIVLLMPFHSMYWWAVGVLAVGAVVLQRGWPPTRIILWAVVIAMLGWGWLDALQDINQWLAIGMGIAGVITWIVLQSTITRNHVTELVTRYRTNQVGTYTFGTIYDATNTYINVAIGVVAIVTMLIALFRTDYTEMWDRLIYLGAGASAVGVMAWFAFQRWRAQGTPKETRTNTALKWVMATVVVVFWWFTFQKETLNMRVDYLGFPWYVLGLSFLGMVVINHVLLGRMPQMLHVISVMLSVVILIGAAIAAITPIDLLHNMYIVNEILVPVSDLVNFSTFIPQYSTLYSLLIELLVQIGGVQNPHSIIDIVYLLLQLVVLVTIYLVVRMHYKNMAVPRWSIAVIFSVPIMLFATSPWWKILSVRTYYPINMFNYSLMANRIFVVFLVGSVGIWVISRIQLWTNSRVQLMAIYGLSLIAMAGLYHNSDFGTFSAISLGVALVCYPFVTLKSRMLFGSVYALGIIVNFVLWLQVLAWRGTAVNYEYLYWFQRQFASGFGAIPINFPGNGLFLIGTAMAVAVTGVWMGIILRDRVTTYANDTKLTHMYVSVVYFGMATVFGLTYYLNRSYMAFHGSSVYGMLFVAIFALYNLMLYIQNSHEHSAGIKIHNFVLRFLVVVPLTIALTYTYIPRKGPYYVSGSVITNAAFGPLFDAVKVSGNVLRDAGFSVAYAGDFAHVIQMYADIPAVSIFNSVLDARASRVSERAYCDQLLAHHAYDVFVIKGIVKSLDETDKICSNDMVIVHAPSMQVHFLVRKSFVQQNPTQWQRLQDIAMREQ